MTQLLLTSATLRAQSTRKKVKVRVEDRDLVQGFDYAYATSDEGVRQSNEWLNVKLLIGGMLAALALVSGSKAVSILTDDPEAPYVISEVASR